MNERPQQHLTCSTTRYNHKANRVKLKAHAHIHAHPCMLVKRVANFFAFKPRDVPRHLQCTTRKTFPNATQQKFSSIQQICRPGAIRAINGSMRAHAHLHFCRPPSRTWPPLARASHVPLRRSSCQSCPCSHGAGAAVRGPAPLLRVAAA